MQEKQQGAISRFWRAHGLFILFSVFLSGLLSFGYLYQTTKNQITYVAAAQLIPTQTVEPLAEKSSISFGKPIRMVIERVGLDLPVTDGYYDPATEEWSFAERSAMTIDNNLPLTPDHGLVYIYGHNATDIFLPTYDLVDGDILEIWTDSGDKLSYLFEEYYLISEHDHHVLDDVIDNRIRLITCQGIGAPLRRLSQFKYLGPAAPTHQQQYTSVTLN